jgi:hypothetical protein
MHFKRSSQTVWWLVVLSRLALNAYSQPSFLTNGLVAYYTFNGNANDSSGNGNNGVLNGTGITFTTDRFGQSNSAAHFAGGGYISVTPTPIPLNTSYSTTFWIELTNTGNPVNNFLSTGEENNGAFNIRDVPNNPVGWAYIPNGPDGIDSILPTNYYAWHAVVCVTQKTNDFLYIDGVLTASGSHAGTSVDAGSMWIGRHEIGNPSFYYDLQGTIDDIRIYNLALSSNEVAQLYSIESTGPPPSITNQPQPLLVNAYSIATFSVTATGARPLAYQWSLDGTNLANGTNSALTISNVTQANLGAYQVTVTNAFGLTNSSVAQLSMYPYLNTPFMGVTTDWGYTNTLSVDAWGTGPLTYQWYDDGIAITNATNSTLTLADIQFTNAGLYSVVVANAYGSVTNTPAQVVVNPAGVSIGTYPGITVTGVVGNTYAIQRNTTLYDTNGWSTVTNLTLEMPVQLWVDTSANINSPTNVQHFYRVVPGD